MLGKEGEDKWVGRRSGIGGGRLVMVKTEKDAREEGGEEEGGWKGRKKEWKDGRRKAKWRVE